ncbi:hypothetical protein GCM10027598_85140 [Amycolatopsis oliviviridis]|uniref:Uncharacterized protein n=1 Tax=Amycolatopsis oliviviridis TaxID=1471590 RepID=A0ABQ3L7L7_9PSEU|nr:hypothetical protein [Amycolatopsis oliviviridis]GHH07852.1 hypothetical protein GCM10017790_15030 [Amycolatopsis oliviviridis]
MSTNFDTEAIKVSAEKIGKIMDDMSAFQALKAQWPNAGKFETAVWLEHIIDDRRNGIVAHGEHLQTVLHDLRATLISIADGFKNTDDDNAKSILQSIQGLEAKISGEIAQFDQQTEAAQQNTAGQATPDDGDGYNDPAQSQSV